ncbi:hypothetical protein PO909_021885 [Leuciscus waleckii]
MHRPEVFYMSLTIVYHTFLSSPSQTHRNMSANQPHSLPLRGLYTSTLGKHKQFSPRCITHPLRRDVV